jgi:hypothetical protein
MEALGSVATAVRVDRCKRAKETGFAAFVKDVEGELDFLRNG